MNERIRVAGKDYRTGSGGACALGDDDFGRKTCLDSGSRGMRRSSYGPIGVGIGNRHQFRDSGAVMIELAAINMMYHDDVP